MAATTELRRTALFDAHVSLGAKMVDFHGWELPIQYESILKEHAAVRSLCGLFDVSHMGQVVAQGRDALKLLQKTNTNDISKIRPGKAIYSHLPNERGGVVDDVIISCLGPERYFVVVNAATREKDFRWLRRQAEGLDVELKDESDYYGMIAVQGPKAEQIVATDFPQAAALPRFGAMECRIFDQPSIITRTGYTGEDGFEFIVPNEMILRVWDNLLTKGRSIGAAPCGLGSRDTLRLEAGYLLYGQDIDDEHTSLEANYGWVVKLDKGPFIGRDILLKQREGGLKRRLTGVALQERGVPRPGCRVFHQGREIGSLASATFSPTLQKGIGVGYLSQADLAAGAALEVEIHGRKVPAQVSAVPFYVSPSLSSRKHHA
ncbi:MAG: glycine cleavage system aminomethyltransferase GcvT [Elusimicrobia bacterium]|nr:glycine cleavage system aminomethyltransferase GcvT [Elusimicrobiota bacterium]